MRNADELRRFARQGWVAAQRDKELYWRDRKRQHGPAAGIRIADELRKQVLAQKPGWPGEEERREDLATGGVRGPIPRFGPGRHRLRRAPPQSAHRRRGTGHPLLPSRAMKLYFAPRTRSVRPRWLLEELEVPYDLVRLDLPKQENQTPDYLAVSPLGEVPALVDGELTLLDPSAICLYLADRFPEKQLAPPPGSTERGAYYQWLLFAEATLAPVVMALHGHAQLPEEQKTAVHAQEALAKHHARLSALLDVVDAEVEDRDFLAAGHFTAADLAMASILHIVNHLKLLEDRPRLMKYVYLHCQRPASRRAAS